MFLPCGLFWKYTDDLALDVRCGHVGFWLWLAPTCPTKASRDLWRVDLRGQSFVLEVASGQGGRPLEVWLGRVLLHPISTFVFLLLVFQEGAAVLLSCLWSSWVQTKTGANSEPQPASPWGVHVRYWVSAMRERDANLPKMKSVWWLWFQVAHI